MRERRRGPWLPVVVSVAAHGLLVLALAFIRTGGEKPARQSIDTRVCLSLDSSSEVHSAILRPQGQAVGGGEEQEWTPTVLSPVPTAQARSITESKSVAGTLPDRHLSSPGNSASQSLGSPAGAAPQGGAGRASLFAPAVEGQRLVFVVDRSMSMGVHHALDYARREVLAHLDRLPASSRFQVIAYNRLADPLTLGNGFELAAGTEQNPTRSFASGALATERQHGPRRCLAAHSRLAAGRDLSLDGCR